MKVGYARVSTQEQNLSLQKDALKQAGCGKIFRDQASGAKAERSGLREAKSFVREGDTLPDTSFKKCDSDHGSLIFLLAQGP